MSHTIWGCEKCDKTPYVAKKPTGENRHVRPDHFRAGGCDATFLGLSAADLAIAGKTMLEPLKLTQAAWATSCRDIAFSKDIERCKKKADRQCGVGFFAARF